MSFFEKLSANVKSMVVDVSALAARVTSPAPSPQLARRTAPTQFASTSKVNEPLPLSSPARSPHPHRRLDAARVGGDDEVFEVTTSASSSPLHRIQRGGAQSTSLRSLPTDEATIGAPHERATVSASSGFFSKISSSVSVSSSAASLLTVATLAMASSQRCRLCKRRSLSSGSSDAKTNGNRQCITCGYYVCEQCNSSTTTAITHQLVNSNEAQWMCQLCIAAEAAATLVTSTAAPSDNSHQQQTPHANHSLRYQSTPSRCAEQSKMRRSLRETSSKTNTSSVVTDQRLKEHNTQQKKQQNQIVNSKMDELNDYETTGEHQNNPGVVTTTSRTNKSLLQHIEEEEAPSTRKSSVALVSKKVKREVNDDIAMFAPQTDIRSSAILDEVIQHSMQMMRSLLITKHSSDESLSAPPAKRIPPPRPPKPAASNTLNAHLQGPVVRSRPYSPAPLLVMQITQDNDTGSPPSSASSLTHAATFSDKARHMFAQQTHWRTIRNEDSVAVVPTTTPSATDIHTTHFTFVEDSSQMGPMNHPGEERTTIVGNDSEISGSSNENLNRQHKTQCADKTEITVNVAQASTRSRSRSDGVDYQYHQRLIRLPFSHEYRMQRFLTKNSSGSGMSGSDDSLANIAILKNNKRIFRGFSTNGSEQQASEEKIIEESGIESARSRESVLFPAKVELTKQSMIWSSDLSSQPQTNPLTVVPDGQQQQEQTSQSLFCVVSRSNEHLSSLPRLPRSNTALSSQRQHKSSVPCARTAVRHTTSRRALSCSSRSGGAGSNDADQRSQVILCARNLHDFVWQQSLDKDVDENLTALAKVLLIEHKRAQQQKQRRSLQTTTESSAEVTSQPLSQSMSRDDSHNLDSKRNSFSSRQDSSISTTESERARQHQLCAATSASMKSKNKFVNRRRSIMAKMKSSTTTTTGEMEIAYEYGDDDNSNSVSTSEGCGEAVQRGLYSCQSSDSSATRHDDAGMMRHQDTLASHDDVFENDESSHENIAVQHIEVIEQQVAMIDRSRPRSIRRLPDLPKSAFTTEVLTSEDHKTRDVLGRDEVNNNRNRSSTTGTATHDDAAERVSMSSGGSQKSRLRFASLDSHARRYSKKRGEEGDGDTNGDASPDSTDGGGGTRDSPSSCKSTGRSKCKSVDMNATPQLDSQFFAMFVKELSTITRQRSIDYPCIVRKAPNLSDIVRKRLLFQKVNHSATLLGETFSTSTDKDHVPRAVRKIIIRKDNSIEIMITRPPKLRRHTMSEDAHATCDVDALAVAKSSAEIMRNPSLLSIASSGENRRKTIETCEDIFRQSEASTKLRARTPPSNPHRILIYRDKVDNSIRTGGMGMRVVGGQECDDGSLGCFVTLVVKGGPADSNSIEIGDQILEFNGHSLIDSTYEEFRSLQNNCGDYVQLVVHHNNIRGNSPLDISRHYETVPRLCPSSNRKRRNLPPLPSLPHVSATGKLSGTSSTTKLKPTVAGDEKNLVSPVIVDKDYVTAESLRVPVSTLKPILINRGRLLMQIWDNSTSHSLAITINQASNLPSRSAEDEWRTFVSGRLIFEEAPAQTFETKPCSPASSCLNGVCVWNETFVLSYANCEAIEEATLEIQMHDTQTCDDTRQLRENFIGMVMLPLAEANMEDEPRWYDLREKPTRKSSAASVTFKSSSNDDSQDSSSERRDATKKSFAMRRLSKQHGSSEKKKSLSPVRKLSQAFARLLSYNKRRSSESSALTKKASTIRFDVKDEDESNTQMSGKASTLSVQHNKRRRHTELLDVTFLLPSGDVSRHSSIVSLASSSSKRSSFNDISAFIDEDIDKYFTDEQLKLDLTPGKGQLEPQGDRTENVVMGDLKLSIIMSKGRLEICVYEARNLTKRENSTTLDNAYVKTYLRTNTRQFHKRKTAMCKLQTKPQANGVSHLVPFNAKLTYNACDVLGSYLQVVMMWNKTNKKFEKNECIGEAFIQLNSLDLAQQTISWYKLYRQHAIENAFEDENN